MTFLKKLWIDIAAGGGLVFVLVVVVLLGRVAPTMISAGGDLPVTVLSDNTNRATVKKLRLAVTPTHVQPSPIDGSPMPWDDMGKLLRELGAGYQFDLLDPNQLVRHPEHLDGYDVLFLTCAPGGQDLAPLLKNFVHKGGTLYASDYRYDAVAAAFPELVDPRLAGSGTVQNVSADVLDPGLRELLGPTLHLRFDLSQWKVASFQGAGVSTLLSGKYRRQRHPQDNFGDAAVGPLLVRFTSGKGTVIFTSFHNEKQNSEMEKKLLQYLVFSLVTAPIDAEINQKIQDDGFATTKANLLSTPKDNPKVTRTYQNSRVGPLRVALGFRNEGARMHLQLQSPDGKQFSWEGESMLLLEVPNAAVGEWTYTVTALRLPYDNFPFRVMIGEKK